MSPQDDWTGLPFDGEDEELPGPRRAPLTVSELTAQLKHLVEDEFSSVTVEGEISNCRPWSTGHIYFTLKDEKARLSNLMLTMMQKMEVNAETFVDSLGPVSEVLA